MPITALTRQIIGKNFKFLILVHPEIRVLERARAEILADTNLAEINIGGELSAVLVETPAHEWKRTIQRWFAEKVDANRPEPCLCSQIDLLFEPALEIDPLALFLKAAQRIDVIVLWPGAYSDGVLSYAVPEHGHYRSWRISEPAPTIICLQDIV